MTDEYPPAETIALPAGRFTLDRVAVDVVIPLRHAVLRPGLPVESARWDGDLDPATRHYAALDESGEPAACATILLNRYRADAAYQLRGMAVRSDLAGQGLGSALLRYLEADLTIRPDSPPPRLIWANARQIATPFYLSRGYAIASDLFQIEGVGPHYIITKSLDRSIV